MAGAKCRLVLASASPRRRELLAQIGAEFEIFPATGEEHSSATKPEQAVLELSRQKAEEVAGKFLNSQRFPRKDSFGAPPTPASLEHCKTGKAGESQQAGADSPRTEKAEGFQQMGVGIESSRTGKSEVGVGIGSSRTGKSERTVILGADTVVAFQGEILGKPKDGADAARMLRMLSGNTHSVFTGVTAILLENHTTIQALSFFEETKVTMHPMAEEELKAYVATGEPMDKAGAYGIQGKCAIFIEKIAGDYNNVVGLPLAALYQNLKKSGIEIL